MLTDRANGIGGSDVGAIYNLDWGCRRALWYEKRRVQQDFPPEQRPELLRRGKLLEDDAIAEYEAVTGRVVTLDVEADGRQKQRRSAWHTWAMVHVDGFLTDEHGRQGVLEIKVLGREPFRRATKNGLRESYILQLQHAMFVTGAAWGSFGVLCLDPWKLAHFDMDRDDELITKMLAAEEEFWKEVTDGPMPDPLPDLKDRRCASCPWRRTCRGQEWIASGLEDDGEVEIDPTIEQVAAEFSEAQELTAEAEGYEAEAKARLLAALGARPAVDSGAFRIYHREHPVTDWDRKALTQRAKADKMFAALLQKFRKTTTQQPLRLYRKRS